MQGNIYKRNFIVLVMSKDGDFSEISYVFGVMSIVMAFFTPLAGFVLGVIGFVQSKKQNTTLAKKAKNLSVWGMILSIIVFVILVIVTFYFAKQELASLI